MINRTQEEIIQKWPKEWEEPTVSVRCITYNHEPYIAQALDSFLMQETTFPFEIIVHDDASTDKTADIIREYEAKFPQIIKPIYETENQYSKRDGSLRRIMTKACNGKYIAYCEGDDYWCDSHKLQKQYEAMEAHPECSLCTHVVQVVAENGVVLNRKIPQNTFSDRNVIPQNTLAKEIIAKHQHPLQTSSYFLRKRTLQKNEYFFSAPGNGDEKILRICLHEGFFYFIPSVMSCYRTQSKGSWTSRELLGKTNGRLKLLSNTIKLNDFFNSYTRKKFQNFIDEGNKIIKIKILIIEKNFKELFSAPNVETTKKYLSKKEQKIYYFLSIMPSFFTTLYTLLEPYYSKIRRKKIKQISK